MVPPEDVAELAQAKGIPIYMISTREAKLEPVSATVFERMAAATGRRSLLRQDLAGPAESFRRHPQRPGSSLHHQLLSPAQPQSRMARYHREDSWGAREEYSHPYPGWLSSTACDCVFTGPRGEPVIRRSIFRGLYQTRQGSFRIMGEPGLQENAFPNSGRFETMPFTRYRSGEWVSAVASTRAVCGRVSVHQLCP